MKGERLGEFEEVVLLCARRLGDDAHGASIQEVLARSAGREVTLGAIYAALDRVQRKGLAESWLGEAALAESRRVREVLWAGPREARS